MKPRTETVSAYHLAYDNAQRIIDERTDEVFNREAYSRMKYGDTLATRSFADDVARVLSHSIPDLIQKPEAPEFLVAYKAVPPACFYLGRFCLDSINEARAAEGNEPGRLIHVYKSRVAATDYAAASHEARQQELSNIGFTLEGRRLEGTQAVILDDIKITGSAEQKMLEVVQPAQPHSIVLGYVAMFNTIQAATSPGVERDLNLSVIQSIDDLLPAIKADNFDLNIRTLKMILNTSPESLISFLEEVPDRLLEAITRGSIDTGPDFTRQYSAGYQTVIAQHRKRIG